MDGGRFGGLRRPAVAGVLTLLPSTTSSREGTPPSLGDACLVGRWIDQRSVDSTDWSFNGQVVPVAGPAADGSRVNVPTGSGAFTAQFFLGGRTESTYSAHAGAASIESYSCTATTLVESAQVGSRTNTDSYLRG